MRDRKGTKKPARKESKQLQDQPFGALKQAEIDLSRLAAIVENTSDLVYVALPDFSIIYINPRGKSLLGWSDDTILLSPKIQMAHPPWVAKTIQEKAVPIAMRDGIWTGETAILSPDGSEIPASQVIISHKSSTGELEYLSTIIRDISEHIEADDALRESEEKYRTIFESASDAIFTVKLTNEGPIFQEFNSNALEMFGCAKDDLVGASPLAFSPSIQADGRSSARKIIEIAVTMMEERTMSFEWRHCKLDGTAFDVEVRLDRIDLGEDTHLQAVVRDVTKRKTAEEEMQKLASVVRYSNELVSIASLDGEMVFLNEAGLNMLGIAPDEVEKVHILEVIPDHLAELVVNELLPALLRGDTWEGDLQYKNTKSGQLIDVHAMTFTIKDQVTNEPLYLANVSLDITERVKAENELRENEARFRALTENAMDAFTILNQDGSLRFATKSASTMLGFKPGETRGGLEFEYIHPDDLQAVIDIFTKLVNSPDNTAAVKEIRIQHKDGSWHTLEVVARNMINDPAIRGIVVNQRDITERKRAETALQESEKRFRDMADLLPQPVFEIGVHGNITFASRSGYEMFGYEEKDLESGFHFTNVLVPQDRETARRDAARILNGDDPGIVEYTALRKDGSTFPALVSAVPVMGDDGTQGFRGVLIDISDKRRAEEKEREAENLKELDRLRKELLSNVSHELRTPLGSIKGFSSLLIEYGEKLTEEEKMEHLASIEASADRLTELVNHLLDMSRLDAGLLKLDLHPSNIAPLIRKTVTEAQVRAAGHEITMNFPNDLPEIMADARRVRQVLDNIIDNAIKYSNPGTSIIIQAKETDSGIEVRVVDEGMGIPETELERVFDRMYRVKHSRPGNRTGIGLGLAICRGIIESHGGKIWMETNEGTGSTCVFTLMKGVTQDGSRKQQGTESYSLG